MINDNKLLLVFTVIVLISGCEKKADFSTQGQAEAIESAKIEMYDSVENEDMPRKETSHEDHTEETKIGITLKYDPPAYDRIVYVNQNITELYFLKTAIISVEGLSLLKNLDTIVFDKTSLHDFSFLTEVPQLKRLFIVWITENVDWSFIEQMPNLEVLHIESYRLFDNENYYQPTISIDLKNNNNLEYIGFTSGLLETFPILLNIPDSLIYLNLQGNKIASLPINYLFNSIKYLNLGINEIGTIPADFDAYKNTIIFLKGNPFKADATTPTNIAMEWESFEPKYRIPINMPFISDVGN
jgi:hypothetical protein